MSREWYLTGHPPVPEVDTESPRVKYAASKMKGLVLDVACNTGFFANILNEECRYVGVDLNKALLREAKSGIQADCLYLPFRDEVFDSVFAGEIIEHFEKPGELLIELRRILKLSGLLVLTTPLFLKGISPVRPHLHEYGEDEAKKVVGKFFKVEKVQVMPQNLERAWRKIIVIDCAKKC